MSTIRVTWVQLQIPAHAEGVPINPTDPLFGKRCGCGCGCSSCGKPPAGPQCPKASARPVRYGTGEIALEATDLSSGGFGVPWGHTRSYANQLTQTTDVGNGPNWQVAEWTYLAFQQLVDLDGSITAYAVGSGTLLWRRDPAGNQLTVVSTLANGFNFSEVQRRYTEGGNTTVESFLYTYSDPTLAFPQLSSVTLRRQVNGGSWTNVTQSLYTYYGANEPYGGQGDLKTVVTQTWDGSAWVSTGTTYYRYYHGMIIAQNTCYRPS